MIVPPGFDRAIAREAAFLVQLAYDQFRNPEWNLGTGYQILGALRAAGEGLGFVARNQTTRNVFVVFRGAQELRDWRANLSLPPVVHEWGMVEQGFSGLYQECTVSVIQAVKRAPDAPGVFATGHSLGAALATLAAADLAIHGIAAALYNFASPRVGNTKFAQAFNANALVTARWRIVNTEDIVTTVPLATPVPLGADMLGAIGTVFAPVHQFDYMHVGTPVDFTVNNGSISGNHNLATYIAALE